MQDPLTIRVTDRLMGTQKTFSVLLLQPAMEKVEWLGCTCTPMDTDITQVFNHSARTLRFINKDGKYVEYVLAHDTRARILED